MPTPRCSSRGRYRKPRDKTSLLFGVSLIFFGTLILFFYSDEILTQFNQTYVRIDGSYLLLLSFGMTGAVVKFVCVQRDSEFIWRHASTRGDSHRSGILSSIREEKLDVSRE
jgi:hypothetical protein